MTDRGSPSSVWRPRIWTLAKWSLLLGMVAAAAYWFKFAPLAVAVLPLQRGTVVVEVLGTGTLEARISMTVSPKIAGRIAQVMVDQGDEVLQGDLLVQLDDEELQQQVAIADANVDAALAAIVRLQADKERTAAVFEQAARHHARIKVLSDNNSTTAEELEQAAESLAIALADIARAEAAIVEGQKSRIAAEKTSEYHRARLKETRIEAPFDGMIVRRQREAGDIAVPGSTVLTLISREILWINAWVDETEIDRVAAGQPVRVTFRSEPNQNYQGTVIRLGRQADRETREFIVDVEVAELPAQWAVGQRADVMIEVARKDHVLLLPTAVLVRNQSIEGVFVIDQHVARWQPLELGLRGRDTVEVLSGLDGADVVIVPPAGAGALVNGRKVHAP